MITKICGIKNEDTLICCEDNNVDFFGMIFYPKSPRNISIEDASNLQKKSENLNINGVGVFVNKNINEIEDIIKKVRLKYVQLHGSEDEEYIKTLKRIGVKVIKSISISNINDLRNISNYNSSDYFLFDYKPMKNELPGGNAKSFDWNIIKDINISKPWFLSGGISMGNIGIIKSQIKPYAIDLSSSMEKKLGIKDNAIINNFMEKFYNA